MLKILLLSFWGFLILPLRAYTQKPPILAIGVGFPEFTHLSVRLPFEKIQIGLSCGRALGVYSNADKPQPISISADLRYYCGGKARYVERQPWYGKLGLSFNRSESTEYRRDFIFLNPRIGREFNLTPRLGLELDWGVSILLKHVRTRKMPQGPLLNDYTIDLPVFTGISTSLFFRL